jgi:rhodanese-related sulfurtransferase
MMLAPGGAALIDTSDRHTRRGEPHMADAPRITAAEVKRRMDEGEHVVLLDTRNPTAWAEADSMIPGAIRVPADDVDAYLRQIPRGPMTVTYCT